MSVPTGHAEGWFFQKPRPTGHVLAGIVVVVVVEELVVELVVVVGRVVVVEDEVLVDVVLVVVVGVLLRSEDSRARKASWTPPKALWAPPAVPGNTVDVV